MPKKDYVKNSKVGDILNQAALKDFKDQSNSSKSILVEFNGVNYKIETVGTISNMKYSKSFEDQVLEFMKTINDDMKNIKSDMNNLKSDMNNLKSDMNNLKLDVRDIKSRLDILEKDMKDIKSLPTIKKEMKNR